MEEEEKLEWGHEEGMMNFFVHVRLRRQATRRMKGERGGGTHAESQGRGGGVSSTWTGFGLHSMSGSLCVRWAGCMLGLTGKAPDRANFRFNADINRIQAILAQASRAGGIFFSLLEASHRL